MKAKEYANLFKEEMSDFEYEKTVTKVLINFISEVEDIRALRNAHTDSSLIAIIKEQNNKWNALARMVSGLNQDGFKAFMLIKMPELKNKI